jgi:predicted 3-demethylubiquinone-9 3-methyltransferase (glyoxalase superfamily)
MQKITTFLWFDDNAEEAAKFYVSIFGKSKMGKVSRYGDAGPGKKGSVMSLSFTLEGQHFMALNGGPHYKLTPAISLFVSCKNQKEVDTLWRKLLKGGGAESQCGWLQDKFGLSWQIIPDALGKLLAHKDKGKASRAMNAMLGMKKIDVRALERAAARTD